MPTPITHGLVGAALAQVAPAETPRWKSAMLLAFIAAMPDLDMVFHSRGVAYSSQLGHRGLSHSFFFAGCVAIVVGAFIFRRPKRLQSALAFATLAFIAVSSHALLDAATNGGLGIGLLIPFVDERFFFPFRPIIVSPFAPATFLERGYRILLSEVIWVWCPLLTISAGYQTAEVVRKIVLRKRAESPTP